MCADRYPRLTLTKKTWAKSPFPLACRLIKRTCTQTCTHSNTCELKQANTQRKTTLAYGCCIGSPDWKPALKKTPTEMSVICTLRNHENHHQNHRFFTTLQTSFASSARGIDAIDVPFQAKIVLGKTKQSFPILSFISTPLSFN